MASSSSCGFSYRTPFRLRAPLLACLFRCFAFLLLLAFVEEHEVALADRPEQLAQTQGASLTVSTLDRDVIALGEYGSHLELLLLGVPVDLARGDLSDLPDFLVRVQQSLGIGMLGRRALRAACPRFLVQPGVD